MYQSQAPCLINGYGPIRRPYGLQQFSDVVERLQDDLKMVLTDLCRQLNQGTQVSSAVGYDYSLTDGTRAAAVLFVGVPIEAERCRLAVLIRGDRHREAVCFVEHYPVSDRHLELFMRELNRVLAVVVPTAA